MKNLDKAEKYYDDLYSKKKLLHINIEEVQKKWLQPCYKTGSDYFSDNNKAFHKIIQQNGGWNEKHVLDYACGVGNWSIYYALTGAKKVDGFDKSKTAIKIAEKRIKEQKLEDKIKLDVMNASDLKYQNEKFDVVIGVGAIHHVIFSPDIFGEIYRIMKQGSRAFFLENLADFPIHKIYWKIKGEKTQGGVPIYSKEICKKTQMFSNVEICGDDFLYSLKKFIWKENADEIRKKILLYLKKFDDVLFSFNPLLRGLGSMCYITLIK